MSSAPRPGLNHHRTTTQSLTETVMSHADNIWEDRAMVMETDDDIQAVLRTLRLAKAQLQILKRHFAKDPNKAVEIADMEMAIEVIIKKLGNTKPE
jgi:tRNA uridine 5-carbamoylmethylation protein Kti12